MCVKQLSSCLAQEKHWLYTLGVCYYYYIIIIIIVIIIVIIAE